MGAWLKGGSLTAALLLGVAVTPLVTASPAAARSCAALAADRTTGGGRPQLILTPPDALARAVLTPADVAVTQRGTALPVSAVRRTTPTASDVVLVVDTSTASASVAEAVLTAATTFLRALPTQSRVAVVTSGGAPSVVHRLGLGPAEALPALDQLAPGGADRLLDAVSAAIDQLPAAPGRQQQVVLLAAAPDEGSSATWDAVQRQLTKRGMPFDVLDLSLDGPALPEAGPQCPPTVAAASAAAAASHLAATVADRWLVTLGGAPDDGEIDVTLTSGDVVVSAKTRSRGPVAVAPRPRAVQDRSHEVGAGTLILAFVFGLMMLGAVLVVAALRSSRGPAVVAGLRDVRRAVMASQLPEQEVRRRRHDAWNDLNAALAGGPTSVQLAEVAAYDEATVRNVILEQARAADERDAARQRSAERLRRTRQRAEEYAAAQRAAREATARLSGMVGLISAGADGGKVPRQALEEAERTLAAQRAAAQRAMLQRVEAEQAAEEAMRRAERERAAADEAVRTRTAAEEAAAAARLRAEQEVRDAGQASTDRLAAEADARAAAEEAEEERRLAEAATARRVAAETQAAEAEAAQDLAVHRELTALEAADLAEQARLEAVARLAEDAPDRTVDLREGVPSLVLPATGTVARRGITVSRVAPGGNGSKPGAGAGAGNGRPGDHGDGEGPDEAEGVAPAEPTDESAEPVGAAVDETVDETVPAVEEGADDAAEVEETADAATTEVEEETAEDTTEVETAEADDAVGSGPADEPPSDVAGAGAEPAPEWEHPLPRSTPPWLPDAEGGAPELSRRLPVVTRLVAVLLVPVAFALRSLVAGSWWSGMTGVGLLMLELAAVLMVVGVRWVWQVTTPPHALLRRRARRVASAAQLRQDQVDEAVRLLAAVADGRAEEEATWEEFEDRTGLHLPASTRGVIDPEMNPAALVRYLAVRQGEDLPRPQPLVLVALVPLVTCLLPAALLVLSA